MEFSSLGFGSLDSTLNVDSKADAILPVRLGRRIAEEGKAQEPTPPTNTAPSHDVARRVSNYLYWPKGTDEAMRDRIVAAHPSLRHRNPNDLHTCFVPGGTEVLLPPESHIPTHMTSLVSFVTELPS